MPRSWNKAFQVERRGNTEILRPAEHAWRVQGTEPQPAWLELNVRGGRPQREAGSLTHQGKKLGINPNGESWGVRGLTGQNLFLKATLVSVMRNRL